MYSLFLTVALVFVIGLRWRKKVKTRISRGVERAHHYDQSWPRSDSDIVHRIDGREGPILSLAFVAAEKRIATLSRDDDRLQVWSIENDRLETTHSSIKHDSGSTITTLTASKDGGFLISGDDQGKAIVWNTTTDPSWVSRQLGAVTRRITALDISQDSTRVACGSEDGGVVVWCIDKGGCLVGSFENRASPVTSIKFSPTGGWIAATHYLVGWEDSSVRIWNDIAGVEVPENLPAAESTHSLVWSGDSKRLFVGCSSGSIKCFDIMTRSLIFECRAPFRDHITSLHIARNNELLISVSSGLSKMIDIWDTCAIPATKPIRSCDGTYIANVSSDGERLATVERDNSITIQRLSTVVGWPQSFHRIHPFTASLEPFTYISETALEAWESGKLTEVEEVLSKEIKDSCYPDFSRYQRANRALVRVQRKNWAGASEDVSASGDDQTTIITSIVKALMLYRQGNIDEAIRVFEFALQTPSCDNNARRFIECIKHIAYLEPGCPGRARCGTEISTALCGDSLHRLVEARRFSVFASNYVSGGDYSKAHDSLGNVPDLFPIFDVPEVRTVCLIFNWNLHDLIANIHKLRCRALFQLRYLPAGLSYFSKKHGDLGEECTALTAELSLMSEEFGVKAMSHQRYEEAIAWYTEALSLAWCPSDSVNGSTSTVPQVKNNTLYLGKTEVSAEIQALLSRRASLYAERSEGEAARKSWASALTDADHAIQIDPSQPLGYQGKYTALIGMKRYDEACVTLGEMSSKIRSYGDPEINAFRSRCASELESIGDEALPAGRHNEAVKTYSTILSFCPTSNLDNVLVKWASTALTCGSAEGALVAALKFRLPKFDISRTICEILEGKDRFMEAVLCFNQIEDDTRADAEDYKGRSQWRSEFRCRCRAKLEKLSDAAMQFKRHQEAAGHLTALLLLSVNTANRMDILIKRGKARVLMESWSEALSDADETIEIDPLNHRGHHIKHAALHGIGRHREADEAFGTLHSVLDKSSDPVVRELRHHYICARHATRRIVDDAVRHIPEVLIDTSVGCLCDKRQQADAFEKDPIYNDLVSSMDVKPDETQIRKAAKKFYRYAMFSHRWEDKEPLFQEVKRTAVDQLQASPGNTKLKKFRSLACDLGFRWAWSDTCCIDKDDKAVLERSLVAMFRWYRSSGLTIVYLQDVPSEPRVAGSLRGSIWNSRAWTYQEYVAAEIIQFYSKDWTPYFGLALFNDEKSLCNHKNTPCIVSEMEEATKVVLRPGLDMVREKLYLASKRKSTLEEDSAYSLFGILKVYDMQVMYGEGNRAVGRLLGQVLTGSGDVTVLAWTGSSGEYNSCLPRDLTVYDTRKPRHIPLPIGDIKMDKLPSSLHLKRVLEIYELVYPLPSPKVVAGRLELSGLSSPITQLVQISETGSHRRTYRATTSMFGDVKIETAEDLPDSKDLFVFHPWIYHLLKEGHSKGVDKTKRALGFISRLRQEFGAFLFIQDSHRQHRRVAADSLIMTKVREAVSLTELKAGICTVDVL